MAVTDAIPASLFDTVRVIYYRLFDRSQLTRTLQNSGRCQRKSINSASNLHIRLATGVCFAQ